MDEPEDLEIPMPGDWNDTDGWERHYQWSVQHNPLRLPGSFDGDRVQPFVAQLLAEGRNTVWLPGCGTSPLAKHFTLLGLNVHATDISPAAVEFQNSEQNRMNLPAGVTDARPGAFTCAVHDFRETYLENHFDVIFNAKAFQGFPETTKSQIAKTHFHALKPGGMAYFDTINVQGERRDRIEESLISAGFFIFFYELERERRHRLRETGITYNEILGQAFVNHKSDDSARRQEILRAIEIEFRQRFKDENERELQRRKPVDRVASVIYSTG